MAEGERWRRQEEHRAPAGMWYPAVLRVSLRLPGRESGAGS